MKKQVILISIILILIIFTIPLNYSITTTHNVTTTKIITTTTISLGLGDNFQTFLIAIYILLISTALILFFDAINLNEKIMKRIRGKK